MLEALGAGHLHDLALHVGDVLLGDDDGATLDADALQELLDHVHELHVEDGAGQLDVTEVAGTHGVAHAARWASLSIVDGAHAHVEDAALDGLCAGIDVMGDDLYHRPLENLLGASKAELDRRHRIDDILARKFFVHVGVCL